MTQQNYTDIAHVIKNNRFDANEDAKGTLSKLAYDMADKFRREDSGFKYRRFLEECGILPE